MDLRPRLLPLAHRSDDLVVTELPDEVLVYDGRSHRAHCLSPAAALVWRRCDGRTAEGEVADELAARGVPDARSVVAQALEQLEEIGLVASTTPREEILVRSRRRALRQMAVIGGAALALPLVQSIVAPSSAEACTTYNGGPHDRCDESACCGPPLTCGDQGRCCLPMGAACSRSSDCCPPLPCNKVGPDPTNKICGG